MYSKTTHNICITVEPTYSEAHSRPASGFFVWSYHITIKNFGSSIVQLMTRYWHITDARGKFREVQGAGVVGEQPVLRPNESFSYESSVDLPTESGFMAGSYIFQNIDGDRTLLEVEIPAFSLDLPHVRHVLN